MNTFSDFQKYKFDKLGYVKVPKMFVPKQEIERFGLPENFTSEDLLKCLVEEGYKKKLASGFFPKDKEKEYRERIEHEFKEISNLKFTDYIILIYRFIQFCRQNKILNAPSRGSGGGSLLLAALDAVSLMDPVKHNLLFSRFISSARSDVKEFDGEIYIGSATLADFDIDTQSTRRHETDVWLEQAFPGRVSSISNISTLQTKMLLKDLFKYFEGVDEDTAKKVSDLVESRFGKIDTLEQTLENPEFKAWADRNPRILASALKLHGNVSHSSVHASGRLVSNDPLLDTIPLMLDSHKNVCCCYDMESVQYVGIKLDSLATKVLDVIQETIDLAGLDINKIDVNHPSIYDYLNNNDNFYGLFQIEEGLGKDTIKKIKPKSIEDIVLSISLGRPGSLKFIDDAADVKNNNLEIEVDERIRPILKESYGIIAYQEQIMLISQTMAGFDAKLADRLRKGIGKKQKEIIKELRPKFIEGSVKNGFDEGFANEIFDVFEASGDYSFNKCLSPDSIVRTENSPKRMFEIKKGDKILCYDIGLNKNVYAPVKDIYSNQVVLYKVALDNGTEISCSLDHKFLTESLEMLPLWEVLRQEAALISLELFKGIELKGPKIVSIRKIGLRETLDFQIDHKDHNFYANDIVVSNSHSTSYSYITAICTYLKANHTKEFYYALLKNAKNEQKPVEEVNKIAKEMVNMGLKLIPPSVARSDIDYMVCDEGILMGLGNIKGISAKAIEKIKKFRIEKPTKLDVFNAALNAKIPSNVFGSLVLAGSLDEYLFGRSRSLCLLEYILWKELTPRERGHCVEFCEEQKGDLFALVKTLNEVKKDAKGKPLIKDSRRQTLRSHIDPHWRLFKKNEANLPIAYYFFEKELLGFSYSNSLYELYKPRVPDLKSLNEVLGGVDGEFFKVAGMVTWVKKGKTKKDIPYFKLEICDDKDSVICYLFSNSRSDNIAACENINGRLPEEKDIVIVRGTKKNGGLWLDNIGIQDVKMFLRVSDIKNESE